MIILNPSQNKNLLRINIFPPKIHTTDFLDINNNNNNNNNNSNNNDDDDDDDAVHHLKGVKLWMINQ